MEVCKNRWDGTVGAVALKFDAFGTRFRATGDGREYEPYPNRRKNLGGGIDSSSSSSSNHSSSKASGLTSLEESSN